MGQLRPRANCPVHSFDGHSEMLARLTRAAGPRQASLQAFRKLFCGLLLSGHLGGHLLLSLMGSTAP